MVTGVVASVLLAAACSSGTPDATSATTSAPSPSTTASTTPSGASVPDSYDEVASGPQPPKKGAWVGAWVKPEVMSQAGRVSAVSAFEKQLGRPLDVVHVYHDWDEPFPNEADEKFAKDGAVMLLSWSGTDTRLIQSGRYDDLIRKDAEALKQWGADVLLEWRWEMDRPNLSSQVWSAQDYIAAWKHIRGIFAEVGVPNVGWVWCPLAVGFDTNRAQPFYPGDDQVDWVCADVYPGKDVKPFATGAGSFLTWAAEHPKPIIIGEFGMKEERGETKRQDWLRALRTYVKTKPQIKALVYFNADNRDAEKSYNMDLLSSPGSLQAFRELAGDPYFNVRAK
jgi:hypothetical protein